MRRSEREPHIALINASGRRVHMSRAIVTVEKGFGGMTVIFSVTPSPMDQIITHIALCYYDGREIRRKEIDATPIHSGGCTFNYTLECVFDLDKLT